MLNTAHLHPMIVHFPIALIMVGFLAEVVSLFFKSEKCLSKTGFYLMILGTLAAIAAWSTGQLFTNEPTQGAVMQVFERHETGAFITMVTMILCSAFRIYLVIDKERRNSAEMDCFWHLFPWIFCCCLYRLYGRSHGI